MTTEGRKPRSASRTPRVRETAAAYVASGDITEGERPTKKNIRLHQSLIDRARRILGTPTETATIEAALDLVAFRDELISGVESMRGKELANLFE